MKEKKKGPRTDAVVQERAEGEWEREYRRQERREFWMEVGWNAFVSFIASVVTTLIVLWATSH